MTFETETYATTTPTDMDWAEPEEALPADYYEKLPAPTYWRLLIAPKEPEVKSKGGIVLTPTTQQAQEYQTYVGKVLAVGPLCGTRAPLNAAEFDIKVGDNVLFGRYAGQRIQYMGTKLILCNDEDILATVPDPDLLKVSV